MKLRYVLATFATMVALAPSIQAQLGSRTAEGWVQTLETPARVASLKIGAVVGRLGLRAGDVVADIGAGTGLFEATLAAAVGPKGTVYAEEVDPKLVEHIAARVGTSKMANVRTALGGYTDPRLPTKDIDLAFINDVLHHIEKRDEYLKTLATYLKPSGRIAIIEFHPEKGGHPAQPELQITRAQGDALLAQAGFRPQETIELFDEKWFVIYAR